MPWSPPPLTRFSLQLARRLAALPLAAAVFACHCGDKPPPAPGASAADLRKPATTTARCPLDAPQVAGLADDGAEPPVRVDQALAAFDAAFEAERYEEALACAQEAARVDPGDPSAHIDRGAALDALDQADEARDAYDRALALDPENPEALRASADFLLRRGTDDALETAALYARRGREHAPEAAQGADLAALEASALNGLGRSQDALEAAQSALALSEELVPALVERGVALFELLRFGDARPALEAARAADDADAKAAFFLALLDERDGRDGPAGELFAAAAGLDPDTYPAALDLDGPGFDALVRAEIARLAEADRTALATTDFSWSELPAVDDLQAGEPVLSPTIVGLYRPGEEGHKDAILIYRRNLLRLCRTADELHREVRDTLLHELGHLHGADDAELRDRGL